MDAAHIIHEGTQLVGVTSSPNQDVATSSVAVIFLNAGFLHHVGPNRLFVHLSRRLAKQGFASVRFDFSGLGDSQPNPNIMDHQAQFAQEASWAMDFMTERYGATQFVLMGLCSGAVDALAIAHGDKRVCGVMGIDGIGFRTPRFYVNHVRHHLLPRLFSLPHVKRLIQRTAAKCFTKSTEEYPVDRNSDGGLYSYSDDGNFANKSKEEFAEVLTQLVNRSMKMRFIYTGGVSNFYNYATQFGDMFNNPVITKNISSRYFPESDHLFMLQHHRNALVEDICDWMNDQYLAQGLGLLATETAATAEKPSATSVSAA